MEKIKQFITSDRGKDILVVIIVILVGLGSFELGKLSKGTSGSGIDVEYSKVSENQQSNAISAISEKTTKAPISEKNFFASGRGSKYYPVSCTGGKNIKQENRIYFSTKEEAEGAGYELSSTCR